MFYVMSGPRGDYGKYRKLLNKIRLKDTDVLYVLGNVINGANEGMKILLDMMMRTNVYPVIGSSEYLALPCLKYLADNTGDDAMTNMDDKVRTRMMRLISAGGKQTIFTFRALNEEQREMVLDYLSDFSLYEEVEVGGKDYVLVSAGIKNFEPDKDLDDYGIKDLITEGADYSKKYFDDKILVTAQTPTRRIYEENDPLAETTPNGEASRFDKIYTGSNHIAINCGSDIGGRLAAIRLDDMAEYYTD